MGLWWVYTFDAAKRRHLYPRVCVKLVYAIGSAYYGVRSINPALYKPTGTYSIVAITFSSSNQQVELINI